MCDEELVIDHNNFDEYFFDTQTHGPKPGQVLACYEAVAELVEGNLKRDVIQLLANKNNAGETAPKVLRRLGGAEARCAVQTAKEIVEDLLSGMTVQEVVDKPYKYRFQQFYYTKKEYIPTNDKRWWSTSLVEANLDEDSFYKMFEKST